MKSIKIITREGKRFQMTLDTKKDKELSSTFEFTGSRNQRWEELYVHEGNTEKHFYLYHVSRWEGEKNTIELLSKEKAIEWMDNKPIGDDEYDTMKKYDLVLEEA
jgi:hypothetical protein